MSKLPFKKNSFGERYGSLLIPIIYISGLFTVILPALIGVNANTIPQNQRRRPFIQARTSAELYEQGVSKFKQKDFQGAITAYTQAIEKNPNYAEAYNGRADARFRKGDKSGALADYSEAIKLNPNFANAYFNRARTYSNLKDKQKAIADYQLAAKLYQKQGRQDRYEQAMKRIKTLENIRRRK